MPAPLARRLLLLLGVRACVCGRLVPVYRAACGRSQAALHGPERRYIGGASFDEVKAYYRELASVGLPVLDWAQQTVWGIQSARVSDRLLRSDLVRSDHQIPGCGQAERCLKRRRWRNRALSGHDGGACLAPRRPQRLTTPR